MLTIHVWPKRLKEFLLTHPLYKSPEALSSTGVSQKPPLRIGSTGKKPFRVMTLTIPIWIPEVISPA